MFRPRNKELYETCKRFSKKALCILTGQLRRGDSIPCAMSEKVSINDEHGSLTGTYESVPQIYAFVDRYEKKLQQLPEYEACIEVMNRDEAARKHFGCLVGTSSFLTRVDAAGCLRSLLIDMSNQGQFQFNLSLFNNIYQKLEGFFYAELLEYEAVSPLHNFRSDTGTLNLDGGLVIDRLPRDELEEILRSMLEAKWTFPSPFRMSTHCMRLSYSMPKLIEPCIAEYRHPATKRQIPPARETFERLISALRLFQAGTIGCSIIQYSPKAWEPCRAMSYETGLDPKVYHGSPYELTQDRAEQFYRFWNEFKDIDVSKTKALNVAIRRFNYAYGRERPDDKLIDQMIAFETLFLPESNELGYRLSIRVACLLEQESSKRQETFEAMRHAYKLRSRLVHGDEVDTNELTRITSTTEEYLRRCIKRVIEMLQQHSHNDIIEKLDASLFDPEK
jgi:hypothetical protein